MANLNKLPPTWNQKYKSSLIGCLLYWVLYTIIVGGGILFFGAVLVHDTIELTKDAFGTGKEEPNNKE